MMIIAEVIVEKERWLMRLESMPGHKDVSLLRVSHPLGERRYISTQIGH